MELAASKYGQKTAQEFTGVRGMGPAAFWPNSIMLDALCKCPCKIQSSQPYISVILWSLAPISEAASSIKTISINMEVTAGAAPLGK